TFSLLRPFNVAVVTLVVASLLVCELGYAQAPIVTSNELKQALVDSANARKQNLDQVQSFFSDKTARSALASSHLNSDRVLKAVSTLNADELARLAAETKRAQADFAT